MKRTSIFLILLCLVAPFALADFWTGNQLYVYLKNAEDGLIDGMSQKEQIEIMGQTSGAVGYVMGIFDALAGIQFPYARVTGIQLKDIVFNYLKAHPETRHLPASQLILAAFKEAFPKK